MSRTRFYSNLKNKGFGKKIVHGNEYFVGLAEKEEGFLRWMIRKSYLLNDKAYNGWIKWNVILNHYMYEKK